MGFTQFRINKILIDRHNGNVQATCENLLDEEALAKEFGQRFREI